MNVFDWIDKKLIGAITAAVIIGICAASVRAMAEKEKTKPFLIRLFSGAIVSGVIAYITRDMNLPSWMSGITAFASGWAAAEVGAGLARMGKKKVSETFGVNDEKITTNES